MKKGFTLIELLAVIIILAILMIIAVPNILSTLATARSSAFITQAESVYKAAEQQYIIDTMTGTASSCYDKNNLNLGSISSTISFTVQMSNNGTVSSITINDSGQQLKASGTTMNNIALTTYANETLSCSGSSNNTPVQPTFGGTKVNAQSGDTHKGIVYLNPKNLTATCTSTSTLTNTNTGCKKLFIFDDSGDSYKMIMWKSTSSGVVAWNTNNSNVAPNEVATALASDTSGWSGSPRLITADEVASIVGISNATNDSTKPGTGWLSSKTFSISNPTTDNSSWFYFDASGTTYSSTDGWQKQSLTNGKSAYKWLYDYSNGCTSYGCDNDDNSTYGYWTSTAVSGDSTNVWGVASVGNLSPRYVGADGGYSIRPVITISKSAIS